MPVERQRMRRTVCLVVGAVILQAGIATPSRGGTVLVEIQQAFVEISPSPPSQESLHSVVVSPDGSSVYVSTPGGHGVAVLSRDAQTGLLSYVEDFADGIPGVSGLDDPGPMAVTPDGRNLYVATLQGRTLVHFQRSLADGRLTFVSAQAAPSGVTSVVVSGDGRTLFVSSNFTQLGHQGSELAVYSIDAISGAPSPAPGLPEGSCGAVDVALPPNGDVVYVAGFIGNRSPDSLCVRPRTCYGDFLEIWARDPQTGLPSGSAPLTSYCPAHTYLYRTPDRILLAPPGQRLLMNDNFAVAEVDLSGAEPILVGTAGYEQRGVEGFIDTRDFELSADGSRLYVAAWNASFPSTNWGALSWFHRNPAGELTFVEALLAGQSAGVAAANSVAASPDGRFVYVASLTSQRLSVLEHQSVCTPAPRLGCRGATRARLALVSDAGAKRRLAFNWDGPATGILSGDPWGGTTYSVCVYADGGGNPTLLTSVDAPQSKFSHFRRGWKRDSVFAPTRYRFVDPFRVPEGAGPVILEAGRVRFRAKGANMPPVPLPVVGGLTAQVTSTQGECWSASFAAEDVRALGPTLNRLVAHWRAPAP